MNGRFARHIAWLIIVFAAWNNSFFHHDWLRNCHLTLIINYVFLRILFKFISLIAKFEICFAVGKFINDTLWFLRMISSPIPLFNLRNINMLCNKHFFKFRSLIFNELSSVGRLFIVKFKYLSSFFWLMRK